MTNYVWGNETQFFFQLTPEIVLDAIEALGISTTGRCLQLGSMENRVYEIEVDRPEFEIKSPSDKFLVAKFYRPGRWNQNQIKDEHQFLLDLEEQELPVIAPLILNGETLFKLKDHDIFYCLFPKKGGRAPEELNEEQLQIMGRTLGRIHNVGASSIAKNRLSINTKTYGEQNLNFLLEKNIIPPQYAKGYESAVREICEVSSPLFNNVKNIRIHGDCHKGNIIYRDDIPYFIDFDDMLMGPAVQDIWLVVPGVDEEAVNDRMILLEAYDSLRSFNYEELKLIEPLRALRYIHFAAWMAKRWDDPIFKENFPYFNTDQYWAEQVYDLNEQLRTIKGPSSNYGNGSDDDYYY